VKTVAAGVVLGELSFVAIMFVRSLWQRIVLLGVAVGFILSLGFAMQPPNPTLLWLLLVFVNWNWAGEKLRWLKERLSAFVRAPETAP
jgi:hypothetical protein